ncbi:MAG: DNA polymerase IV [Candidatus Aenigmatarchaeota archaeon]
MTPGKTKILHVDMDSFFASAEARRKNIKNEPIVVCVYSGRTENSGAVSTTNYKAREYGIKSAMSITKAKRVAENVEGKESIKFHFIPVDKEYYREISDQIRERVLEKYSDRIEQASIDEFYLDISEEIENWEKAKFIGEEIQRNVEEKFGITCSVGIGPNKLIAKIASDRKKPEGLTLVRDEKVKEFMNSLDLKDVHGIGNKTIESLSEIGIENVKELSEDDKGILIEKFGKNLGPKLIEKAKGIGDTRVKEEKQKQISRITTLKENSRDSEYIEEYLGKLSKDLNKKLNKREMKARKVTLIVIDEELDMKTLSKSFKASFDDIDLILDGGIELLLKYLNENQEEIRRIGLRVSDLQESSGQKRLDDF